ncbi:hypothetical protein GCM10028806_57710 [Spirosoma terrae]|uniref:Oligosaccharide flippase family protein n=1 Tax=Spirosoma terrae TaxID=1968276 RepID=A0A6L9LGI3_9BACT|nr:hypothetical protein [Spirosoma terrae]NDU97993.1 hypothetical protein [Spirosoma terrae]
MLKRKSDIYRLLKGVSYSWIRFVLTIGIGIFQTPLLFKYLNKEEISFWYIFYALGAFLQMADLGLVQTISRLIAYIDTTKDDRFDNDLISKLAYYSVKQIYATSLISFSIILVLIGTVSLIIYVHIYDLSKHSINLEISFLIYIIGVIFSLISNIPAAILIGYRDVGIDSGIRSISQIIYFILLFFLLPHYQSIIFVTSCFALQNFLQFYSIHKFLCKKYKHQVDGKSLFKLDNIKIDIANQIYKQSLPLALTQLGAWLISQGNIFVASIIVGANAISDYAINQQIFLYITSISLVINQSLGPFIARYHSKNEKEAIKLLFNSTMILCLSIVSILIIIEINCAPNIMSLWVGSDHFLGNSFSIVFGIITFLEVQHSIAGNFVWNTGSWPFNKWTLIAGLLTVGLGYFLGKYNGLFGIALATLISRLITLNWYVMYYTLKRLNVLFSSYIKQILLPILLITYATYYMTNVIYQLINENMTDIVNILLIAILSFIVFVSLTGILFRKSIQFIYNTIVLPKIEHKI